MYLSVFNCSKKIVGLFSTADTFNTKLPEIAMLASKDFKFHKEKTQDVVKQAENECLWPKKSVTLRFLVKSNLFPKKIHRSVQVFLN